MPPVRMVVPSTVKCLSKPKLRNPKTVSGNSSNTTLNKPYHLSQGKHCKVRKKNIAQNTLEWLDTVDTVAKAKI